MHPDWCLDTFITEAYSEILQNESLSYQHSSSIVTSGCRSKFLSTVPTRFSNALRMYARSTSTSTELKGVDLLEAITDLVATNPGLLDVHKVYRRWNVLKGFGYQVDFSKDIRLFQECSERIFWKTMCLRIKKRPVTVENLLEILDSSDPLPINYDVLMNNDTKSIMQTIYELLTHHGANPDHIESLKKSCHDTSKPMTMKRTLYTVYLLLSFFNTTADMIAWQMNSVTLIDNNLLAQECSQINKLGLEMPDHIVIYLRGYIPENMPPTAVPSSKHYINLVDSLLHPGEKWEPSMNERKELDEVVRRHQADISGAHDTLGHLLLQGYKLVDIRSCLLILSFRVRYIREVLRSHPEFEESLLKLEDPPTRLRVLFVFMDRKAKFNVTKSISMKNTHSHSYRDRTYLL